LVQYIAPRGAARCRKAATARIGCPTKAGSPQSEQPWSLEEDRFINRTQVCQPIAWPRAGHQRRLRPSEARKLSADFDRSRKSLAGGPAADQGVRPTSVGFRPCLTSASESTSVWRVSVNAARMSVFGPKRRAKNMNENTGSACGRILCFRGCVRHGFRQQRYAVLSLA
jgi:hypothetical protein